ncbi:hypothetical protein BH23ACT10_BH23ACT10_30450 [soil metagenome]
MASALLLAPTTDPDSGAGQDSVAIEGLDGVPLVLVEEALDGSVGFADDGEALEITLDADVLFRFDSARLTPQAQRGLGEVRDSLASTTGPVTIVGHTDAKGTDTYNDRLSRRRAEAVRSALADDLRTAGVTATIEGRGERDPVAPKAKEDGSDNPKGRARNRRVTVTIPAGVAGN